MPEEFLVLLIPLVILCIISGPIALVLSIIALSRISNKSNMPPQEPAVPPRPYAPSPAVAVPVPTSVAPLEGYTPLRPSVDIRPEATTPPPAVSIPQTAKRRPQPQPQFTPPTRPWPEPQPVPEPAIAPAASRPSLEQIIGTRWVMIAGVISVIFAVGFFLKYAYDNAMIGPWGRIAIAAAAGLAALIIGEVTRRRDYQIVAKGVTALGFAILYATVFSAYRVYHLIPATSSFALAIFVTAGAMAYATILDEVLMAVLALLGGYLTPILLSTGQNLPVPLFFYVLILGLGAMGCAVYRKWPGVNLMCFFGTYGLYTGWFESFYRSTMNSVEGLPPQMAIALIWLGIFFVVFLALPLVYGLVNNSPARKQDVTLILSNAAATLYYLWTILYPAHRNEMALCCAALFAIHLAAALAVYRRCPEDDDCRMGLVAIGLFFVTLAIPLYFRMYIVALSWSAEAAVLCFIGLRYRSWLTQLAAAVAMTLSLYKLAEQLPLHNELFTLAFNPQFGSWCFVAAMAGLGHVLYRRPHESLFPDDFRDTVVSLLYALSMTILMAACLMEWYCHCDINLGSIHESQTVFHRGLFVLAAVIPLLFLIRPLIPAGPILPRISVALCGLSTAYVLIAFVLVHKSAYAIFVNGWFAYGTMFVASLFLWAFLLRRAWPQTDWNLVLAATITLFVRLVAGILVSEELALFWYCRNEFAGPVTGWYFYAVLSVAILWAVYGTFLIPWLGIILGVAGSACLIVMYPTVHTVAFTIGLNSWFLTGLGFVASLFVGCAILRWKWQPGEPQDTIIRHVVLAAKFMLGILVSEELILYWFCRNQYGTPTPAWFYYAVMSVAILWAVYGSFLLPRVGMLMGLVGCACLTMLFPPAHFVAYSIVFNPLFSVGFGFVAALAIAAILIRRQVPCEHPDRWAWAVLALSAVVILWILTTEEIYLYWDCSHRYTRLPENWTYFSNMYISIFWALYGAILMVAGFAKHLRFVRYLALGLFALLLAKVFLIDMSNVRSVYRMAAFLATGLTLLGVSYLYQYARKKGLLDTVK
jgi:uncharacterized membrane protein